MPAIEYPQSPDTPVSHLPFSPSVRHGDLIFVSGQASVDKTGKIIAGTFEEEFRRSIYVTVRRKQPLTVLDAFDAPSMLPNCETRNRSTVTPQSLLMMNDTFILETARALATRLRNEAPGDARGQIGQAWRTLYGQTPTDDDVSRTLAYLAEQTEAIRAYHLGLKPVKGAPPSDPPLEALASLCQVLLGSNRFLYVE